MRIEDSTSSRLNIILREQEQIELIKACMSRLSMARGGVKVSAIQTLLELSKFYLENVDKIEPVSETMRALAEKIQR